MDHIKQGKALNHSVNPPSVPSREEIIFFKDSLAGTISSKLKELLNRLGKLRKKREEDLSFVRQKTRTGSDEEYFLALLAEHEFSETHYIQKWIKYWLAIWYGITGKHTPEKLQKRLSKFDQVEIEKARQYPIEKLYEGELKQSGSKLVGLCIFHKEEIPSFFVFSDNHYHCYGCGEHGDAISFVVKQRGLNFPDAVRYLT